MIHEEKLKILERFGHADIQDLCAEIRRLRASLEDAKQLLIAAQNPGIDMDGHES